MDENYYDDSNDSGSEGGKEKGPNSSTSLLPKSVLMGKDFKVGDEVVLKITAIHGDEVAVEYASGEDESPKEDAAEGSEEAPAEGDPEMAMAGDGGGEEAGGMYD